MDKKKLWVFVYLLHIALFTISIPLMFFLIKENKGHQVKKPTTFKCIMVDDEPKGPYYFDEKHTFPYKKDTITVNSCFELITKDTLMVKLRCVCSCDEFLKKNK